MQSVRHIKYKFEIEIVKANILIPFKCLLQILLRRGQQKITTKKHIKLEGGEHEHLFDQRIWLVVTLAFDQHSQRFINKEASISLVLLTEVGNKIGGIVPVSLSGFLNDHLQKGKPISSDFESAFNHTLQRCPQQSATLAYIVRSKYLHETQQQNSVGSAVSFSSSSSMNLNSGRLHDMTFRLQSQSSEKKIFSEEKLLKRQFKENSYMQHMINSPPTPKTNIYQDSDSLLKKINQLEKGKNELNNQRINLQRKHDQERLAMTSCYQKASQQLSEMTKQKDQFLVKLQDQSKEIRQLQEILSNNQKGLGQRQRQVDSLKHSLNEYVNRQRQFLNINKTFQEKLKQVQQISIKLKNDLALKDQDLKHFRFQNQQLKERITFCQKEKQRVLQEKDLEFNRQNSRYLSLEQQLISSRQRMAQVQLKLQSKQSQQSQNLRSFQRQAQQVKIRISQKIISLQQSVRVYQIEVQKKADEVQKLNSKIAEISQNNSNLQAALKKQRSQLQTLQKKIIQNQKKNQIMKAQFQKLYNSKLAKDKEMEDHQKNFTAIHNRLISLENLQSKHSQLERQKEIITLKLNKINSQLNQTRQQLHTNILQKNALKDSLGEKSEQMASLIKLMNTAKGQSQQSLRRSTMQVQSARNELNAIKLKFSLQLKKLKDEQSKLQQQNENLRQQTEKLTSQVSLLNQKNEKAALQQHSSLSQLTLRLQQSTLRAQSIKNQKDQLILELLSLKETFSKVQKKYKQLEGALKVMNQKNRISQEKLKTYQSGHQSLKKSMEKTIIRERQNFKDYLGKSAAREQQHVFSLQKRSQELAKRCQMSEKLANDKDAIIAQCWQTISNLQQRVSIQKTFKEQELGKLRAQLEEADQERMGLQERAQQKQNFIVLIKAQLQKSADQQRNILNELAQLRQDYDGKSARLSQLSKLLQENKQECRLLRQRIVQQQEELKKGPAKSSQEQICKLQSLAMGECNLMQSVRLKIQFLSKMLRESQTRMEEKKQSEKCWALKVEKQQVIQKLASIIVQITKKDIKPLLSSFANSSQSLDQLLRALLVQEVKEERKERQPLRTGEGERAMQRKDERIKKLQRDLKKAEEQNLRLNVKMMRQLSQIKKRHSLKEQH